ncbi:MAG: 30S ribosomal protein S20 [Acidimicrobiia bacterium]|nr:30S ribosomal protein S20 [Acidimicrobiia bacterium]
MANLKSQIKRNRQTVKQTARNKALRSELRTRTRSALETAESGDSEAADIALRAAKKQIDIATSRGILHRNTAARRKSRLEQRVRQLLSG